MNLTDHAFLLPKHSRLFHVFNNNYPVGSFNDSGKGSRRFDPIFATNGKVIPTLYTADTYIDAIAETIMRKSTNETRQFTGDIKVQGILQADAMRDLNLVDMNDMKEYQSLLQQGNQAYPALNTFAQWLAQNHPSVDGITWYGYQRGEAGHRCYVFWGDRKNSIEFESRIVENLIDVSAIVKLKDASLALHCELPENIVKFRI